MVVAANNSNFQIMGKIREFLHRMVVKTVNEIKRIRKDHVELAVPPTGGGEAAPFGLHRTVGDGIPTFNLIAFQAKLPDQRLGERGLDLDDGRGRL
jgi:hypothetical protein